MPIKERKLRVYKSTRNYDQPSIVLQGAWLAEAGFTPGDYISVSCQENRLTIQIEKKFDPTDEALKFRR